MDIDIVNAVLRLCVEQQTCLFEVPHLCDYCLEQRLCTNAKYVLASIKNYMEIFKISRDQNRIELFMPFELCRNYSINGQCQLNGTNGESCRNLHVCYDYFSSGSCRRGSDCPYPHALTKHFHEIILDSLINLDLDVLSKAFRVYCHSKKNVLLSSRLQQQLPVSSASGTNNSTPSSSAASNWRSITAAPQISGNTSWRAANRTTITSRIVSTQQPTPPPEKGLQIRWSPQTDIQSHFIEVVFSNQMKCDGGPMRTHDVYKHFGIAQVFYQNPETVDRVVLHGPVTFQSFTFTPRLLRRSVDMRHVCFANMPTETNRIAVYIDTVSSPYKQNTFDYYLNDKQTIVVEYNEDIDFAKISTNIRSRPECGGLPIKCIQLYHPETLLIEYDNERSEDEIKQLFKDERIFHIKTYSCCAFVHFYCHDDLARLIKTTFDEPIRMTPIYIDIYSQRNFDEYLKQRQIELQSKPVIIAPVLPVKTKPIQTGNWRKKRKSLPDVDASTGVQREPKQENLEAASILPTPSCPRSELLTAIEEKPSVVVPKPTKQEIRPSATLPPVSKDRTVARKDSAKQASSQLRKQQQQPPPPPPPPPPPVAAQPVENGEDNDDEEEMIISDDDFQDLPTDFDDDELFLDNSTENNGDMEFLRSAAKNLMSSLAEMEAASANTNTIDAPHSLLYGDDYIVTIKSRRFALAFLDYTQFRVEKQRNPDKFRLLASLKRNTISSNSKKLTLKQRDRTLSPASQGSPPRIPPELSSTVAPVETKSAKKRRKRNKKKKTPHNNGQGSENEMLSE